MSDSKEQEQDVDVEQVGTDAEALEPDQIDEEVYIDDVIDKQSLEGEQFVGDDQIVTVSDDQKELVDNPDETAYVKGVENQDDTLLDSTLLNKIEQSPGPPEDDIAQIEKVDDNAAEQIVEVELSENGDKHLDSEKISQLTFGSDFGEKQEKASFQTEKSDAESFLSDNVQRIIVREFSEDMILETSPKMLDNDNEPDDLQPMGGNATTENQTVAEAHSEMDDKTSLLAEKVTGIVDSNIKPKEEILSDSDKVKETKHFSDDQPFIPIISADTGDKDGENLTAQDRLDEYSKPTAIVKLLIQDSNEFGTITYPLHSTFELLRHQVGSMLNVLPENIIIKCKDHLDKELADDMTLTHLGVNVNGLIQFELSSTDPENVPLHFYASQKRTHEYRMPDILTVKVLTDDNQTKEVTIEVERPIRKKPFIGGFRHKITNVEYHNASTMTMRRAAASKPFDKFSRDTQTHKMTHRVIQTKNSMSTQMTKIGVYVSNVTDNLISPREYVTADEYLDGKLQKVVIIQKYYRRWLAKRRCDALRKMRDERQQWEAEREVKLLEERENRLKDEFNRRMNPKTKKDFDILYAALERWRLEELKRIDDTLTGAERKAALYMLMEKQTELIAAIGRHLNEANQIMHNQQIQDFLNKTSELKKWKCSYDGSTVSVDTPYTLRARELKDIYNSINMKFLTNDERLDILLTLKHTVKEHDCKLTKEIIELIDREADLLMRGIKDTNLEGLRTRISTLFLQYIKTPLFNPEVAYLLKAPQDPSALRDNIRYCKSCSRYLKNSDFSTNVSERNDICKSCCKTDNDGRLRYSYSHYSHMLKLLRVEEERRNDGSCIVYLIQDRDMRYLVENIWNNRSMLSAWDELVDLVMVRWDRNVEWSPWNCILLTREEAEAHRKLNHIEDGYEPIFIQRVNQRHILAKNYFSKFPNLARELREKLYQRHMTNGPSVTGHRTSAKIIKA